MSTSTTEKGQRAEQLALHYLKGQGYRILQRNYRCRLGEIDLVAEEAGVLCFVEVRSTNSRAFGDPLETINAKKQARIIRTARYYLTVTGSHKRQVRFDVVGIVFEPELRIELIRGAFEASGAR